MWIRGMRRFYAPEDGEGNGSAGAGGGSAVTEAQSGAGEQGAAAPGGEAKPAADMLSAINSALGYDKKGEGEGTPAGEKAAAQPPAGKDQAAAPNPADDLRKFLVEKGAKAEDLANLPEAELKKQVDAAKAVDAAKPKDLDALALTEAEKKTWKKETAERFESVRQIAKTERQAREAAEAQITPLRQSRDAILTILKDTNTTDQDLASLLEFNRMLKSSDPASLEAALKVVEGQRVRLLKTLGREGDGHDPLAEFPDLQQEVTDLKITRERALELVQVRKRDALEKQNRERDQQQRDSQQRGTQQREKAVSEGLTSIDTWCADQAKTDIDFKAKEAILLPQIDGIIRGYPPNLWLPTIKTVYAAIVVQKQAAALPGAGTNTPLRSSGAKPGAPAPTSMAEAIDQGLGYAKG